MGKYHWIGRQRAAIGMARAASSTEARLIHDEMAGRHALQGAMSPPFMLPRHGPATEGERAVLHLADRQPRRRDESGEPGAPAATRR
jgi:hypothetical protein